MKRILFIDDQPSYMLEYIEHLKELGFDVLLKTRADDAQGFIANQERNIDCAILDIMLPHGEAYSASSTDQGLITGLKLHKEIREAYGPHLLVAILTNSTNPLIQDLVSDDVSTHLFFKGDVYYDEFGDAIKELLLD